MRTCTDGHDWFPLKQIKVVNLCAYANRLTSHYEAAIIDEGANGKAEGMRDTSPLQNITGSRPVTRTASLDRSQKVFASAP